MPRSATPSRFSAQLQRPAQVGRAKAWAFLLLPKSVSDTLPRRGRTSVQGTLNGHAFQATLEPDGQLSHWLKIDSALCKASGATAGDTVAVELAPMAKEPEPALPPDLKNALAAHPEAQAVWDATTTMARVDWIHWIESAKQAATRQSRVEGACDMLASGKKRVCCFDPSGFYSKGLGAPQGGG